MEKRVLLPFALPPAHARFPRMDRHDPLSKRSPKRRLGPGRTRRRTPQILRDPLDGLVVPVRVGPLEDLFHQRHRLIQTPPTVRGGRTVRRTQGESSAVARFPGRAQVGTARGHRGSEGRFGHPTTTTRAVAAQRRGLVRARQHRRRALRRAAGSARSHGGSGRVFVGVDKLGR